MSAIKTAFDNAFRDYQTEGVPASGAHEPIKGDIRGIGALVEDAALRRFGRFDTLADLIAFDAAANFSDGFVGYVIGRAALGDMPALAVRWVAASSAAHDGFSVFRPGTGAAATGNGRWLRVAANPTQTFTVADATPSVKNGDFFVTAGSTAITNFDDAAEGQTFTIQRGASDIEIRHDATKIDLGGSSFLLTATSPRAVFKFVNGVHRLLSTRGEVRQRLTADLDVNVATTGNDTTGDGSVGAPWRTINKALAYGASLDLNLKRFRVLCADGTYSGATDYIEASARWVGVYDETSVQIVGNTTTPANCVLDLSGNSVGICAAFNRGFWGTIKGFRLKNTDAGAYLLKIYEEARVEFDKIEFDGAGAVHYQIAGAYARCGRNSTGSYKIVGNAGIHAVVEVGPAHLELYGATITASGTPTFSDCVFDIGENSQLSLYFATWGTGTSAIVGKRYRRTNGGIILPNRAAADAIPGNAAGTIESDDYSTLTHQRVSVPGGLAGFLTGFTCSNNGTDATNDIDIAAGQCVDSTGAEFIKCGALTKRIDAAWAAGTNQGGLDTGTVADGTYHLHAIKKDSDGTADILFSTSATAPTLPTGYTKFRRIASIMRVGGVIRAFNQFGDLFRYHSSVLDVDATSTGTADTTRTLSVPLGIVVEPVLGVQVNAGASAGAALRVSSLNEIAEAASAANGQSYTASAFAVGGMQAVHGGLMTNTSGQIRSRENQTDSQIRIRTYGFIDRRGRA